MPVLPFEDWHASTLPIHVRCHRMNQLGTLIQVVEHSDGMITKNTTLHVLNLTSVINKILLMKYNNLLATLEQPSTFLPCYRRLEGYKRNKQKRSFLRSHQLHSTSSLVEIILSGKFTVTSRKLYYIVALIIISYWKKIAGLYHLLKGVISENNRMRFTSLFTSVSQSQLGFLKV